MTAWRSSFPVAPSWRPRSSRLPRARRALPSTQPIAMRNSAFYLADLKAKALMVASGTDSPAIEVATALGISVIELRSDTSAPAGVFTFAGALDHLAEPVFAESSDVALALHTSGTTSRPKLVPLTHHNMCVSAGNVAKSLALTQADRCLNVMPLFHIHGLVGATLASLWAGGSVVCTPGFVAPDFFPWMSVFAPTWYTGVPTMHQAILARAEQHPQVIDRHRLRLIRSSSSALPPQVMAQLEAVFGVPVIEAYGMTEAAHQMACNPLPPRPRKPGTVGLPAGPEIAIMDEYGALLTGVGEIGEVVIRGHNVMLGYENDPDANAAAFTDGWFRTGDQGMIDVDGHLVLTGRLKEIINRAGEKISPREVDEVIFHHPAVVQVVTFAVPDSRLGEDVGAAVVLRTGHTVSAQEIRQFVAKRLAYFKVPRTIVFVDEIPKGPTGKLRRIGLAKELGITSAAHANVPEKRPYAPPRSAVEELVASALDRGVESGKRREERRLSPTRGRFRVSNAITLENSGSALAGADRRFLFRRLHSRRTSCHH